MYREKNFGASGYRPTEVSMIWNLMYKYQAQLQGKHCAVLGSRTPWLEALFLHAGAAHVTTIEYAALQSKDSRIDTIQPKDWAQWHRANGSSNPFECVASYSSLEHAGLGRYGDIINPWGDLIAMGKLTCSIKEGSLLFIGMPTSDDDEIIAWNAHRYYGPKRWAQMLANTEQLEYERPFHNRPKTKCGAHEICAFGFDQGMVVAK